jgi:hypothetical protein
MVDGERATGKTVADCRATNPTGDADRESPRSW